MGDKIEKNFEMEKCDQCEYTANKRCSVNAHKLHVHDGKINECDQCDKNFSRKPNLRRHKYFVHDKTNKTKCDQCDYEAYDETAIKRHKINIHEGKFIRCDQCDKQFPIFGGKPSLAKHKLSEHEHFRLKCSLCDYTCRQKNRCMVTFLPCMRTIQNLSVAFVKIYI